MRAAEDIGGQRRAVECSTGEWKAVGDKGGQLSVERESGVHWGTGEGSGVQWGTADGSIYTVTIGVRESSKLNYNRQQLISVCVIDHVTLSLYHQPCHVQSVPLIVSCSINSIDCITFLPPPPPHFI